MRAAEARVFATGVSARELMECAGVAAAAAILRFEAPRAAIVACGPGGNGGDGYVVARHLRAAGVKVTVAADAPPTSDPARAAAADWDGEVVPLAAADAGPVLIDALFGIGMTRRLDAPHLARLAAGARLCVAIDIPSGIGSDDGADLGCPYVADLTITFGALKPGLLLHPSAARAGRIVTADIGIPVEAMLARTIRPDLQPPGPEAHKFARGAVLVVAGPSGRGGAARLAATAALRVGAGLVTIAVPRDAVVEHAAWLDAVMLRVVDDAPDLAALLVDPRLAAVLLGPGLGSDDRARRLVGAALTGARPLVLDGDVFTLFAGAPDALARRIAGPVVLTPHEGEFERLFGTLPGSKVDRARAAAATSGAVVVLKGPDTVIAHPDGRACINAHASPALATAGSGDVLAGLIAGLLGQGRDAFDAACAGVWLHGELGLRGGHGLTADDLPGLLPAALAAL